MSLLLEETRGHRSNVYDERHPNAANSNTKTLSFARPGGK